MGQTEVPICLEKVIRAFSFQDSRYLMLSCTGNGLVWPKVSVLLKMQRNSACIL